MIHKDLQPEYQFTGLPLTPTGIEQLILDMFDGETVERKWIVKQLTEYHHENGGAPMRAKDFPRSVKKALSRLQDNGRASNPQYGYWKIESAENSELNAPVLAARTATPDESPPATCEADHVIGVGDEAVYVYYLPTYRTNAERAGECTWPCKVGRSSHDPLQRVLSQAGTALPETPKVAIILRTSNSVVWEQAIQSVLRAREATLEGAPGTEWFDTTPDAILDIIRFISPNHFNSPS